MKYGLKHLLLFLIILVYTIPLFSQGIRFVSITQDDGLPDRNVIAFAQDQEGFMWFGTFDGIIRYDGVNFTQFTHDPADSNSLSHALVTDLIVDHNNMLWVGTFYEGFNKFDPKTKDFTHYKHDPDDPASLSQNYVSTIYEDKSGWLWIGTGSKGLNLFHKDTGTFTRFKHDPINPNSISGNSIRSIVEDPDSSKTVLWIGTNRGLNRFDVKRNEFTHFLHDPDNPTSLSHNNVRSVEVSRSGDLWIGTARGLNKFDRKEQTFTHYYHDPNDPHSLHFDYIGHLIEDSRGHLWIASGDGVLDRLIPGSTVLAKEMKSASPEKERFFLYTHDPTNPYSLKDTEYIQAIYEDRAGSIWIGYRESGINCFDRNTENFTNYQRQSSNPNSLSNDIVNCVREDQTGIVWIGTMGGGLNRLDRVSGEFTHYKHDPDDTTTLLSNDVLDIREDPDHKGEILWIGTKRGLNKFYVKEGKFASYLRGYSIWNMMVDKSGNLWLGSHTKSLFKFDRENHSYTNYQYDPEYKISWGQWIDFIHEDHDEEGILWLSISNEGMVRFNSHTGTFTKYVHDPSDTTSIQENTHLSFYEDKSGNFWVGRLSGLDRFDKETETFAQVKPKGDFRINRVRGFTEDDNGNLWLGAKNGLFRFNPGTGLIKRFTIRDGLCNNSYNSTGFRSPITGEMFWGGNNGLTIFHPDSIIDNQYSPPIVITAFKKYGREVELGAPLALLDEIALEHDNKVISFEYVALNFINPERNQYAYMLEGFDQNWVFVGNKRDVTYTNLDPGRYVFRVKGSNNDGIWNETSASIAITIPPPPWKSWWAYILYVLATGIAVYAAWHATLTRARIRNELKMKSFEAQKFQEIDQLKSRFFANISHEFRTPLTLILGPIERLQKRIRDKQSKNDLSLMRKHTKRILNLVSQLLDLSKLEARRMKLHTSFQNIVPLLKGVVESFSSLAETNKINLTFKSNPRAINVYYEKDVIVKILTNLLSNALKFTAAGGRVSIDVQTLFGDEQSNAGYIEFSIVDTGIGIAPERLPKIFNRFYQVDSSETREHEGTGIGLSLTKELVELHKGTIAVDSIMDSETTFTVRIPLGKDHLAEDEIVEHIQNFDVEVNIPVDENKVSARKQSLTPRTALPTILIVEDNSDVRKYIRSYLDNEYHCIEAINGAAGLEEARKIVPDLIISDIMMPKMDGVEFCRKIKTDVNTSHIPVILLTAKADIENRLEGLEIGADDYLTKPFEARELLVRINNLIRQRQQLQERFKKEFSIIPDNLPLTSMDEQFMNRVVKLIKENLDNSGFKVEEFSQQIFMSRQHLNRKLKALTGFNPQEFIRSVRLKTAAQLLRQKQASIAEIAYKVGFSSPSHFSKSFRKKYKTSPKEFATNPTIPTTPK